MKTLIIGGVAGGATAATRLRRNDEFSEIVVLEKGKYVSFANCGMPYYIGDIIKSRDELILKTPDDFKTRYNIDVKLSSEALSVDTITKRIQVKNLETGDIFYENYDNLVLSPGARPIKPENIEGIYNENVFTLRNISDMDKIKEYVDSKAISTATVIGGGYIGIEIAENLYNLGINTTIIEAASHVINGIDIDMSHMVHNYIRNRGVKLLTGTKAIKFEKDYVLLEDSKRIESDIIILCVGVIPDTKFLLNSGINLGSRGEIFVDEYLKTNADGVYAVGDAISIDNTILNLKMPVALASNANKQARIVADNICGKNIKYGGSHITSIVKIFDMVIATTGSSEEMLKKNNISYLKSISYSSSNAEYYPGSSVMRIKLLFTPKDGKILGAQIVGYSGVDKRIDVISTAITANMSIYDLCELELAYSPPFSQAKDPINTAGYVAENIISKKSTAFYIEDIENISENDIILDVRTNAEFLRGKLENAIKISVDNLRENLCKLDKNKKIYVYCKIGQRGYIAEQILKQNGYENVYNLNGGYSLYEEMIKDVNIL
ncbi:MAG: FAD-dependent oxidoreductase [Clostridia bacterium]|nr:FAD-dependent oxidoreductase [Clostridia bacterium]